MYLQDDGEYVEEADEGAFAGGIGDESFPNSEGHGADDLTDSLAKQDLKLLHKSYVPHCSWFLLWEKPEEISDYNIISWSLLPPTYCTHSKSVCVGSHEVEIHVSCTCECRLRARAGEQVDDNERLFDFQQVAAEVLEAEEALIDQHRAVLQVTTFRLTAGVA